MTLVRLLNLVVVAALVLAAAYVYKVKFESTLQAEYVAKLRADIRRSGTGEVTIAVAGR